MNTTDRVWAKDQILQMDHDWFPRSWTKSQWAELKEEHHLLYVTGNEIPQGFALFSFIPGDHTAHLLKIALNPDLRGRGEAARFWKDLVLKLKTLGVNDVYLEVEVHNFRAIGFYQKCGFSPLRRVKSYYSDGVDGLMMQLLL